MGFHAEKIKALGAGLLSESNHGLKTAIAETNAILDVISKGLNEADVSGDPIEDTVNFTFETDLHINRIIGAMVLSLEKVAEEGGYDFDEDMVPLLLKKMIQNKSDIIRRSRSLFKKKEAGLSRQIKRGL